MADYGFYIYGAYGVAGFSLFGLLFVSIYDLRQVKKRLASFDE